MTNNQAEITDIIRAVIQSHSSDNISEDVIKKEALEQIQQHCEEGYVDEFHVSVIDSEKSNGFFSLKFVL